MDLLYTAFDGESLVSHGPLQQVVLSVKRWMIKYPSSMVLVFSDQTGKQMDFDLSGTEKQVIGRLSVYNQLPDQSSSVGPGRPKLGVTCREISLLPRHWEWLNNQPGGASVTIRKWVENALKEPSKKDLVRKAQERTHKVLTALSGNRQGYEDALRSMYKNDKKQFMGLINDWPSDLKEYIKRLSDEIWQ